MAYNNSPRNHLLDMIERIKLHYDGVSFFADMALCNERD